MYQTLSLPMYQPESAATRALLQAIQQRLANYSLPARPVFPRGDLLSHWRQDNMLLSQCCGFPLMTALAEVQVVGCFHYSAEGCDGSHYRSALVVRQQDKGATLAAFRGRRAACNAIDSQSGYNALRYSIAPLAQNGAFFSQVKLTGSHRQLLAEIASGAADIAAIDAVSWALFQRDEPTLASELAVIGWTPLTPGLPLIAGANRSPDTLATLRVVLSALVSAPHYITCCEALLITGFSVVPRDAYTVVLDWQRQAAEQGITYL